jgi:hypothetical protein
MREQSAVLQNAFVTIVSNRRLLAQLQQVKSSPDIYCAVEGWFCRVTEPSHACFQDHQTSLNLMNQRHALVLSQAEAAASQFKAEADRCAKQVRPAPTGIGHLWRLTRAQVLEAANEAEAAAREARMFEVAMNLAKTEAKSRFEEAEQLRRDTEILQSLLKEREDAVSAMKVEVAGLKASFRQVSLDEEAAAEEVVGYQQQQKQLQRSLPAQPRPVLGDAEHWPQGTSIALASLPSPSPRNAQAFTASEPELQQQARVFGTAVDPNVNRKGGASKQQHKQLQLGEQPRQYEFGAWPLQRQQQQVDGRSSHSVTWTSGGYSDAAAKKGRQQSSSRGKLVFLR